MATPKKKEKIANNSKPIKDIVNEKRTFNTIANIQKFVGLRR